MRIVPTALPDVLVIEPRVFKDDRGFFFEMHAPRYLEAGIGPFVQDNFSHSAKNTVRGLHFQEPEGQGKLCTVLHGAVMDVAVDVRRGSPTFGKWVCVELDGESLRQIWIPPGFAHGFCVRSEMASFHYKCTRPYAPSAERTIVWDDPDLAIPWPLTDPAHALVSPKDRAAPRLRDAAVLPSSHG